MPSAPGRADPTSEAVSVNKVSRARGNGHRLRDPVRGTEVDRRTAAAETQYEGETYCFCSEDCYQEFMLDPEEYVEPQPEA